LYPAPHPHHLPSFPTRRSSDLELAARTIAAHIKGSLEWSLAEPALKDVKPPTKAAGRRLVTMTAKLVLAALFSASAMKASAETRSEEHTSELQSRFDLVCRLLL